MFTYFTAQCDQCRWQLDETCNFMQDTAVEAMARASEAGWITRGGQLLCTPCRVKAAETRHTTKGEPT